MQMRAKEMKAQFDINSASGKGTCISLVFDIPWFGDKINNYLAELCHMSLRIAIFDDNKNIRESITMLLQTEPSFEVAGSFSNVFDCVNDVMECRPDIVLMDIEMPGMNGIEAVHLIKKEFPQVQILMQTVFENEIEILSFIHLQV